MSSGESNGERNVIYIPNAGQPNYRLPEPGHTPTPAPDQPTATPNPSETPPPTRTPIQPTATPAPSETPTPTERPRNVETLTFDGSTKVYWGGPADPYSPASRLESHVSPKSGTVEITADKRDDNTGWVVATDNKTGERVKVAYRFVYPSYDLPASPPSPDKPNQAPVYFEVRASDMPDLIYKQLADFDEREYTGPRTITKIVASGVGVQGPIKDIPVSTEASIQPQQSGLDELVALGVTAGINGLRESGGVEMTRRNFIQRAVAAASAIAVGRSALDVLNDATRPSSAEEVLEPISFEDMNSVERNYARLPDPLTEVPPNTPFTFEIYIEAPNFQLDFLFGNDPSATDPSITNKAFMLRRSQDGKTYLISPESGARSQGYRAPSIRLDNQFIQCKIEVMPNGTSTMLVPDKDGGIHTLKLPSSNLDDVSTYHTGIRYAGDENAPSVYATVSFDADQRRLLPLEQPSDPESEDFAHWQRLQKVDELNRLESLPSNDHARVYGWFTGLTDINRSHATGADFTRIPNPFMHLVFDPMRGKVPTDSEFITSLNRQPFSLDPHLSPYMAHKEVHAYLEKLGGELLRRVDIGKIPIGPDTNQVSVAKYFRLLQEGRTADHNIRLLFDNFFSPSGGLHPTIERYLGNTMNLPGALEASLPDGTVFDHTLVVPAVQLTPAFIGNIAKTLGAINRGKVQIREVVASSTIPDGMTEQAYATQRAALAQELAKIGITVGAYDVQGPRSLDAQTELMLAEGSQRQAPLILDKPEFESDKHSEKRTFEIKNGLLTVQPGYDKLRQALAQARV